MSKIIQLSDLDNEDREAWKFAQGKATKQFVLEEVYKANAELQDIVREELGRAAEGFGKLFTLQKMLGLQLETLVRMLDAAVPDFRINFGAEYGRTVSFSMFLESLNADGQNSEKSMKEKIDLVREWNKEKTNIRVKGLFFGLPEYIVSHLDEFTLDEVELLAIEFDCPEVYSSFKSLKDAPPSESTTEAVSE